MEQPSQALTKIEPLTSLFKPDHIGRTPLHYAISDVDVLHVFVALGAPLNAQDAKGYTALHCAAAGNKPQTVKYLLAQGALPNLTTHDGTTPLHLAASFCGKAIKILVYAGAQVNTQEQNGWTPLHMAYNHRWYFDQPLNKKGIKALLKAGARINVQDKWGNIPSCHGDETIKELVYSRFKYAVETNNLARARNYIDQGVDVDVSFFPHVEDGYALKTAQERNYSEMVCLLLDHGAKPTKESFKNGTVPTTKLLMTHVPKWLIKEHWNRIGMTLLCSKQCSIPCDVRKTIIYYATKFAITLALFERARSFCALYAESHINIDKHGLMRPISFLTDDSYSQHNVRQYVPVWKAQIDRAAKRKSLSL